MSLTPVIVYSSFTSAESEFLGNFAGQAYQEGDIFYIDNTGQVARLPIGTVGQSLIVNAGESAPEWSTPAGGGDVNKVGTPANNQIGVWTGDGTIEGDSAFTFDTATDTLGMSSGFIMNWNSGDITLTHSANTLTLAGGSLVLPDAGLTIGASVPFSDSAGALTLQNIDALDATTEATIEAAIDTLANLASVNGFTFSVGGNSTINGTFSGTSSGTNTGDQTTIVGITGTKAQFDTAVTNDNFAYLATAQSFTALQTYILAGNTGRFVNTTDSASVQVASFEGDRATFADNDEAYISFLLSNDAGTQTEMGRLTWVATDVNVGTSLDSAIDFSTINAGTLAKRMRLNGTALTPTTNDILALGTTTLMWSDLFLASGGVINFNNGDILITHSANTLTFTGASSGYIYDAVNRPSANDGAALGAAATAWSDLFLASGAVIGFNNGNFTITHSAGLLTFSGAVTVTGALTASAATTTLGVLAGTIDAGGATSFEIPNGAAITLDAAGEVGIDTSVTDFSHGILEYFSGEVMAVIAVPIAELTSPSNGDVVSYNATNDEFELVQPSGAVDVQEFTSTAGGTWNRPATGKRVLVQVWGAGGGGGAGNSSTAFSRGGAGGGGGGAYHEMWFDYDDLASSYAITVGTGGNGGTASAGAGVAGGSSSFGTLVTAYGGGRGDGASNNGATSGGAGGGIASVGANGTNTVSNGGEPRYANATVGADDIAFGGADGQAGGHGANAVNGGGSGGGGNNTTSGWTGGSSLHGGGGGGSGGRCASNDSGAAGGVSSSYATGGGAAGGGTGAAGTAGGSFGRGGGGGGSSNSSTGGVGGAGGTAAGGGGGGCGTTGGAGGAGGNGMVKVTTW